QGSDVSTGDLLDREAAQARQYVPFDQELALLPRLVPLHRALTEVALVDLFDRCAALRLLIGGGVLTLRCYIQDIACDLSGFGDVEGRVSADKVEAAPAAAVIVDVEALLPARPDAQHQAGHARVPYSICRSLGPTGEDEGVGQAPLMRRSPLRLSHR